VRITRVRPRVAACSAVVALSCAPGTVLGAYASAQKVATISDSRINEASGITPSLRVPNLFWIHNDSGDSARIFAVRLDGVVIAEVAVANAGATDWEDIETGPGPEPGVPSIYIADTGNNGYSRTDLRVYRIPEPVLPNLDPGQKLTSAAAAKLRFTYPDGSLDCEGMCVHPVTADVILFSKRSAPSGVYRLTTNVDDGQYHQAEKIATISVPNVVTGASFCPDGMRIAVRTYAAIHEWTIPLASDPLASFFAGAAVTVSPPPESAAEALAYAADGWGIYTVSEGGSPGLYFLRRKDARPQASCEPGPEIPPIGTSTGGIFVRGDSNNDSQVDISDALHILVALFLQTITLPCRDASDSNDDGTLDLTDALVILDWLFHQEATVWSVGRRGPDATMSDDLACEAHDPPPTESTEVVLIDLGAPWSYRGDATAPPETWKDLAFDDSSWSQGPTPIGYGDKVHATVVDMQNKYITLYTRAAFDIADPAKVEDLVLQIDYDDAFVAYIDGIEVARRGLGAAGFIPDTNQLADVTHEAGTAETIRLCFSMLVPGRNVLAIEMHQSTLSSTDLDLVPVLRARIAP
jgi:hypothetical protein